VRLGIRSLRGLARHLIYLVEACAVARMAEAKGVSHIHAHFATNATAVALLVDALGGPSYSFMVHGPSDFDTPELIHLCEKVAGAKQVSWPSSSMACLERRFAAAHPAGSNGGPPLPGGKASGPHCFFAHWRAASVAK